MDVNGYQVLETASPKRCLRPALLKPSALWPWPPRMQQHQSRRHHNQRQQARRAKRPATRWLRRANGSVTCEWFQKTAPLSSDLSPLPKEIRH
jgi:hypothetical protein